MAEKKEFKNLFELDGEDNFKAHFDQYFLGEWKMIRTPWAMVIEGGEEAVYIFRTSGQGGGTSWQVTLVGVDQTLRSLGGDCRWGDEGPHINAALNELTWNWITK